VCLEFTGLEGTYGLVLTSPTVTPGTSFRPLTGHRSGRGAAAVRATGAFHSRLLAPAHHHIDLSAAAAGADEAGAPIEHRRCRAVSLGHFAGVGLDLVPAFLAPYDQADLCRGRTTKPSLVGWGLAS
jgi:hypothetical protein